MKLTFISTAGHGYLKVSKANFRKSGLSADVISGFSGMTKTHLFLEEDSDALKLIRQLEKIGQKYKIKDAYQHRVNTTHNYSSDWIW